VSVLLIAAVVLFAVGWVPVFLLRSERFSERRAVASPDERRAMVNAVAAVGVHVTLTELALTDPGAGPSPAPRLVIGMLVFLVGLAFWALARGTLVAVGRVLDPTAPPPTLVTTGPFAVVRHPLALGMVILALGPAVAAARPLTWVSFVVVVVTLGRRCLQDEAELSETFGHAYERYTERTPSRLVPFVW
jgi:protein-S-isoprenylcysteine O-methyltransferase Ste14